MTTLSTGDWIPIRVQWSEGRPILEWCHRDGATFTDPFFDQTVERYLRRPFSLLFRPMAPIEVIAEMGPFRAPTGLVFHLSRCGSTLVSQMLAAVPDNIVISEAGPIDTIAQAGSSVPGLDVEQHVYWLRAIVSALGTPGREGRPPAGNGIFIKFAPWSACGLGAIRRAFPDTPWVFVYREPLEIMVSQLLQRSAFLIPGGQAPEMVGISVEEMNGMEPEEYCAHALARIGSAALEHADDPRALFINYNELPEMVFTTLLEFFDTQVPAADHRRMAEAAARDAKNPAFPFESDGQARRKMATEAIIEYSNRWLGPVYEQLEETRCRQRERLGLDPRQSDGEP